MRATPVAIAASASFASPVSHPANLLVMGFGGYKFLDYTRVGLPLVALLLALPLGMLAALHKDRGWDAGAMGFSLLGLSIPNFWLGPLLVLLFSVQLGWTPVSGPTFWPRRKTSGSRTGA